MKNLSFYKEGLNCDTQDQVFDCLVSTLKPSNRVWSYFVNWEKVFKEIRAIKGGLKILNSLIGKENFDDEFRSLIKEHPYIIKIIPALAVRDGSHTAKFNILADYEHKTLNYEDYDFSKQDISDRDLDSYLKFVKEIGLKRLISGKKINNLIDYMIGVEAGLDSNGRKNRSGHVMENIVEVFIKDVCDRNGFQYLKEANAKKIKNEFNYTVPVDKASRRYDFVIDNGEELFIVETNFYGGSGSKLKSTAGEYKSLFDTLKGQYKFFWITDGKGWRTAENSLRETFDHNDYIFNLAMLEKGILNCLIS